METLSDMEFSHTDPSYGGIDYYKRTSDDLQIGNDKLDGIYYGFWQGQFTDATMKGTGYVIFSGLKSSAEEKYGKPYRPNQFMDRYTWFGKYSYKSIEYSSVTEKVIFYLSSKEFSKLMEQYDKEQSKKGAKELF